MKVRRKDILTFCFKLLTIHPRFLHYDGDYLFNVNDDGH